MYKKLYFILICTSVNNYSQLFLCIFLLKKYFFISINTNKSYQKFL